MRVWLAHTNIQKTDRVVDQRKTVDIATTEAQIVSFNEANDVRSYLYGKQGWNWHYQGDNALGWSLRFPVLHYSSRKIMEGGHLGAGTSPRDHRRRGPDRYLIWVILDVGGVPVLFAVTHTIARAGSLSWRRPLLWSSLRTAGWVIKRKMKRYGVRHAVFTGDLNWKDYVKIENLRAVKTPATYGKHLHYDQLHVAGKIEVTGLERFRTYSDHWGLRAELSIG